MTDYQQETLPEEQTRVAEDVDYADPWQLEREYRRWLAEREQQAKAKAIARSRPEVVMPSAADFKPRPVQWLWPGRIPLGKMMLLAGDPGLGKSFLTLDLAARVSSGRCWPDVQKAGNTEPSNTPGDVIILSAEDDPEDTICPRLVAAGADLNRVHILQHVLTGADRWAKSFSLDTDRSELADAIQSVENPRLIIIDPITAYLGKLDANRNAAVRDLFAPLSRLAAAAELSIIAITHLTKRSGGSAIYRAMGSLAFTAAVRGVWTIIRDPEDTTDRRRFFLPVKNNIAVDDNGLAFELRRTEDSSAESMPTVHWSQLPRHLTVQQALGTQNNRRTEAVREATDWLQHALADKPQPVRQLRADCEAAGVTWRSVRRAKRHLGVLASKAGFDTGWVWELPLRESGEQSGSPEATAELASVEP